MQSSSSSRVFNPTLAGASPATDAICSQGVISAARRSAKAEVRGASPRESATFNGDHDVTAASRPVKAFVPVRIRLVTPISMRKHFDGPKFAGYRTKTKGWLLTVREPPDTSLVSRVRVPLAKPRICGTTCPSDHPVVQLRENTWVQVREMWVRFPSGVPISTGRRVWVTG